MKKHQEIRHNIFHFVSDEHLAAVQLNLVLIHFKIILHLWKVENAGQIKGVVHIEMNPEQWLFRKGVKLFIELQVVIVNEIFR